MKKDIRLLILGFGNVGRSFARLLENKRREIFDIYDCNVSVIGIITKSRGAIIDNYGLDLTKAIEEIEENGCFDSKGYCYSDISSIEAASSLEYDVLLELTPLEILSGQPAIAHIRAAMNRGSHVICANKGPLAWAYSELKRLAEEKGVQFLFETTVMDGTPVFNLAEKTLSLCKVIEIKGILNSTTNYILEEMEKGISIESILEEGQRMGFVEADSSMDIEGWDAAAKTAVLLNVLMGADITPFDIDRKGIEDIGPEDIKNARERGCVIKLLCHGYVENGNILGKVSPEEIPNDSLLACVNGTSSLLSITTDLMKTVSIVEHEPEIAQTAYGPFIDLLRILND